MSESRDSNPTALGSLPPFAVPSSKVLYADTATIGMDGRITIPQAVLHSLSAVQMVGKPLSVAFDAQDGVLIIG